MIVKILFVLTLLSQFIFAANAELVSDYGSSAKTIALAGIEGVSAQASSLYENPASIQNTDLRNHSFMYSSLADSASSYFNYAFVFPLKSLKIGVGIAELSSSSLDYTDVNGLDEYYVLSNFDVINRLYKLSLSKSMSTQLNMGVSVHYLDHDLFSTRGTGTNIDLGATFEAKKTLYSLSLKNPLTNSKVRYSNSYDSQQFPSRLVLGFQHNLSRPIDLFAQFTKEEDKLLPAIAIAWAPQSDEKRLTFFGGIKYINIADQLKNRLSVGAELALKGISIQFAFQHSEYSFNNSQYSMSLNMNL